MIIRLRSEFVLREHNIFSISAAVHAGFDKACETTSRGHVIAGPMEIQNAYARIQPHVCLMGTFVCCICCMFHAKLPMRKNQDMIKCQL